MHDGSDDVTPTDDPGGLSRRHLLSALGLSAGAGGLLAALPGGSVALAGGLPPRLDALDAKPGGLTYTQIDATAFFTPDSTPGNSYGRYLDDSTGTGSNGNNQPLYAPLLDGMSDADSWAIDCHKWLNVPYDSGMIVVREVEHLRRALSAGSAAYLTQSA